MPGAAATAIALEALTDTPICRGSQLATQHLKADVQNGAILAQQHPPQTSQRRDLENDRFAILAVRAFGVAWRRLRSDNRGVLQSPQTDIAVPPPAPGILLVVGASDDSCWLMVNDADGRSRCS